MSFDPDEFANRVIAEYEAAGRRVIDNVTRPVEPCPNCNPGEDRREIAVASVTIEIKVALPPKGEQ